MFPGAGRGNPWNPARFLFDISLNRRPGWDILAAMNPKQRKTLETIFAKPISKTMPFREIESLMRYKGYRAKVEYSAEDNCLVGHVVDIHDIISFEGQSIQEAEKDFHNAIDQYVEDCRESGKEPDKPNGGKVTLYLPTTAYQTVSREAETSGRSINDLIVAAVEKAYTSAETGKMKTKTRS